MAIRCVVIVCAFGVTIAGCGGGIGDTSNPTGPTSIGTFIPTIGSSAVLVGAGDIAHCGTPGAEETARLLDKISGTVFTTGDNAYMSASEADYRNCYDPTWGRHRDRTRPVPGNHEYRTAGAFAYFNYFGANAGPAGLGYYTYKLGSWLIVALNSEVDMTPASPQGQWLREQLSSNPTRCTAAIWHRPLFSSGPNGRNVDTADLWRVLYEFGVDIVINGHDHLYERFAPQDAEGRPDPVRGIRQFTVGTGGGQLYAMMRTSPNTEVNASVWGVTSFTLESNAYKWEFVPVEGTAFRDSGAALCH